MNHSDCLIFSCFGGRICFWCV